jgi:hypothetical protein
MDRDQKYHSHPFTKFKRKLKINISMVVVGQCDHFPLGLIKKVTWRKMSCAAWLLSCLGSPEPLTIEIQSILAASPTQYTRKAAKFFYYDALPRY